MHKVKKIWSFLCFFFFIVSFSLAQNALTVQGHVQNEDVDSYQVSLIDPTGKLLQGKVFYEQDFRLEFSNIDLSQELKLKVSAFGFDDFFVALKNIKTDQTLKIQLSSLTIEEVRIETKAPEMTLEEGNLIVDVASSPMLSLSGSAEDVLVKIPKLRVVDDQVEIVGQGKVALLLNGMPVTIDIINQIPSEDIKKIEVIENPSAKYAAVSGGGSAINIVTKNEINLKGTSVRLDLGAEVLHYWGANARLNFTQVFNKKLKLSAGYRYYPKERWRTDSLSIYNSVDQIEQKVNSWAKFSNYQDHAGRIKLEFTPSIKHEFSLEHQLIYRAPHRENYSAELITNTPDRLSQDIEDITRWDQNLILNYKLRLDTAVDHSLQFNFSYAPMQRERERTTTQTVPIVSETFRRYKDEKNPFYFQLDYRYPIVKYQLFPEIGMNYQYIENTNAVYTQNGNNTVNNSTEHLLSTYLQLGHQVKKFYYQAGISLDRIQRFLSWTENVYYFNYVPRLRMSYQFDEKNNLSLSYARLIKQPSPEELSDVLENSANTNIFTTGNPNLKQSTSHWVQGSYGWSNLIFFQTKYQYSQNPWFRIIQEDPAQNIFIDAPVNIDFTHYLTLGFTIPYKYKIWSMQYVLQWNNQWLGFGDLPAVAPKWNPSVYFFTMQEVDLGKGFSFSVNYSYQSNQYQNIVKKYNMHNLSTLVSKKWGKAYTLSLEYQDILQQAVRTESENGPLINYRKVYNDTSRIRLRFVANFGGLQQNDGISGGKKGKKNFNGELPRPRPQEELL